MQSLIDQRGAGFEMDPELTEVAPDKIIGSARWPAPDGRPEERHHVLTIRNGQIADMQACKSWRAATRLAAQGARSAEAEPESR